jgi:hypothetical protein
MRIKPATPGAVIRDPDTRRPLPDDGADVQASSFWMRRLRDGEVVEIEPTAEPAQEPAAPAKDPIPGEHAERRGDPIDPVTPLDVPEVAPPADRMTRSTTRRGQ